MRWVVVEVGVGVRVDVEVEAEPILPLPAPQFPPVSLRCVCRCLIPNNRQGYFIYFVVFLVVAVLIGLSWFLGVCIYMMSTSRLTVPVFEALEKKQQDWLDLALNAALRHSSHPKMLSNMELPSKGDESAIKRKYMVLRLRTCWMLNHRYYVYAQFLVELGYFMVLCTMHWNQVAPTLCVPRPPRTLCRG